MVAVGGSTFRDAYEMSASARFLRWGGHALSCNRPNSNTAFGLYLRSIEYPDENRLSRVFSCGTCEEKDSNGKVVMKGVVVDRTATGVLGALPEYYRPRIQIVAPRNTTISQYLFSNIHVRRWIS